MVKFAAIMLVLFSAPMGFVFLVGWYSDLANAVDKFFGWP